MSALNWARVRGTTSPFSYRIYGPPQVDQQGPISAESLSAHKIYCIPWLTGQGGPIDAIHSQLHVAAASDVVAHWGIYAATHARLVIPGGLLSATSFNMTAQIQSVGITYTAQQNAMHYLAWACNTPMVMRRFATGDTLYPILGVDSRGLEMHWGIVASYNVTAGLPTQFPQTGWTFLGDATGVYPPFIGVHYA